MIWPVYYALRIVMPRSKSRSYDDAAQVRFPPFYDLIVNAQKLPHGRFVIVCIQCLHWDLSQLIAGLKSAVCLSVQQAYRFLYSDAIIVNLASGQVN